MAAPTQVPTTIPNTAPTGGARCVPTDSSSNTTTTVSAKTVSARVRFIVPLRLVRTFPHLGKNDYIRLNQVVNYLIADNGP